MKRSAARGLFVAALATLVLGSIVWAPTPIRAVAPQEPDAADSDDPIEKTLTIEAIHSDPPLVGRPPSAIRWMPDSKQVSFLRQVEEDSSQTHWMVAKLKSGKLQTLCILDTIQVPEDMRSPDGTRVSFRSYEWQPEGNLAVFAFGGELFTFDARTGEIRRRTQSDVKETNVTFSPDGRMIAFTRDHDVWALDLETGDETAVTTTGSDSLLNGVLDWVYMEELFTRGDVQGYWWSPDSRHIAYLQIDESPVQEFAITDFAPIYNTATMQHYPQAGSPNPIVRVAIHHVETGQTTVVSVDTEDDSYIARLYWLGDSGHVAIEKLNRAQDAVQLLFADAMTGEVREVFTEEKPTWVNITYMKHYYERSGQFVWASDRDGHTHLYVFKNDGTLVRQITSGPWEVVALDAVDEKRGHIYFTALEKSLLERQLYRVGDNGQGFRRVSRGEGTHAVTFSPDNRYYIDRFSNATTPSIISVHDATGKLLFTLHDSNDAPIADYDLPAPEFFTIMSRDSLEFQCSMIKPPHFDEQEKYPVIVYVYGGPHAQVVRDRWGGSRYLWHAMMAQRGYIIFSLDNRGSFGKGPEWENPVLKNLGHHELQDQMAGVEYLRSQPYVDPTRIGIWGWSYGGYMTCLAMFKEPGVFAAGAAVAPVTDWRFYDTIYTERYMKTPADNTEGYDDSAPLNFVEGLEAPLLIMHGTADDNVHMQNTVRLIEELIDNGKEFELMIYPGKLHGISGRTSQIHLYKQLTRFFELNVGPMREVPSAYPQ